MWQSWPRLRIKDSRDWLSGVGIEEISVICYDSMALNANIWRTCHICASSLGICIILFAAILTK